jgi:hypothetical protein
MSPPALYHFSEEPGITRFDPRTTPARPEITVPLVWAIDEPHQFMYLFPRDCPRILLWPLPATTDEDRQRWFGRSEARALAHIEYGWLDRLRSTRLYRYAVPAEAFESLDDAGMWVARTSVVPDRVDVIDDPVEALRAQGVELRVLDRLAPLYGLWETTTLHWSAIRMRNARDWEPTAGTVPPSLRAMMGEPG